MRNKPKEAAEAMKSTRFVKILDETTVDVDASFQDTVDRLTKLPITCRDADSNDLPLQFFATKQGGILITYISRSRHSIRYDRAYYVKGQVFEDNGQTKIKYCSVYDRSNMIIRYIILAISILIFPLVLLYALSCKEVWNGVAAIVAMCASIAINVFYTNKEKESKHVDLEIMKEEILQRINAVNRWDE